MLFWYVNNLTISSQMFHSSIGNTVSGFSFTNQGTYSTNAYDIQSFPITNIYYSETMNKVCNGYSEQISYYEYAKHELNIVYGGGILYIDGGIMDLNNNFHVIIMDSGYHNIRLFQDKCHDPRELSGGRFLTIWMYNMTRNKDNILESNILYGGNLITNRRSYY